MKSPCFAASAEIADNGQTQITDLRDRPRLQQIVVCADVGRHDLRTDAELQDQIIGADIEGRIGRQGVLRPGRGSEHGGDGGDGETAVHSRTFRDRG